MQVEDIIRDVFCHYTTNPSDSLKQQFNQV